MGYRKKGDSSRNDLVEGDLSNLVYVDHIGQNDIEETSMCREGGFACRYRMRYTGGLGSFGDRRARIPTLSIDNVPVQMDILEWQLGIIVITTGDRSEIQHELDFRNRWRSERNKSGIGPLMMPLITSTEWVQIQARGKIGWSAWQSMGRVKQ